MLDPRIGCHWLCQCWVSFDSQKHWQSRWHPPSAACAAGQHPDSIDHPHNKTDALSLIPLITCTHPAIRGRPPGQLTSHFLLHLAYNTAKPRDSSHSGLFDRQKTSAVTQAYPPHTVRKRTAFMSAPELGCRFSLPWPPATVVCRVAGSASAMNI